ncbi:hypothetical protein CLF_111766 [Clonorchis sinensis]|uniref:Uncharacterized protein n=1 Tax=Clonorchis sinensis TaxID=79923 RepID=G7YVB6_CLOSI|nr:hypothetical protein CLF_111766 [Clonorchis sinensis]
MTRPTEALRILLYRSLDEYNQRYVIIIIIESRTLVFNTDASLSYNHDLFESPTVKKRIKQFGTEKGATAERQLQRDFPLVKWATVTDLDSELLESDEQVVKHVSTPKLENQETVLVNPLTTDRPELRDCECSTDTNSLSQWFTKVHKPPHHDGTLLKERIQHCEPIWLDHVLRMPRRVLLSLSNRGDGNLEMDRIRQKGMNDVTEGFIIIIIVIDNMISVFNTDASFPYNHDFIRFNSTELTWLLFSSGVAVCDDDDDVVVVALREVSSIKSVHAYGCQPMSVSILLSVPIQIA